MTPGTLGPAAILLGLIASLLCIGSYVAMLLMPHLERKLRPVARGCYALTAVGVLTAFGTLISIVFNRQYQYAYAFEHTGNDVSNLWYRVAATWSGQEGSFLLWAVWTTLIGFMVFARAGRYEARVMPFFVSVLTFLTLILLKQSPFQLFMTAHPQWPGIPTEGSGLNQSLQNYWMTIHPPTIFFGFASLAVPYSYALAALIWKDYKDWTIRVMPYALLTCATLGLGLFMGGYWAYETLGWHGFWAWDPVENASFFPWLAITALVHGLVVQRSRGGMARTNTFLGLLAFWLFLVGTFLTRSGALSGKGADGQMMSVHAFDNISKSGLFWMEAMLVGYGLVGLILWLVRLRSMPTRPTTGDTLVSRDFAFFLAMLLMIAACAVVTLGSTTPLFLSWAHRPPSQPQPTFYNKVMLPLTMITALAMGCVPWLAWRKTDPEKFMRKLMIPWFVMLAFGFAMLFWVQGQERAMTAALDAQTLSDTMRHWISPSVQRICVVLLSSLGFLAALSNAMLAYRVFRTKPLNAGGWLAHVGIGLMMIGVIVSNTYERTTLLTLEQGDGGHEVYGYKFDFEGMTGTPKAGRPLDPEYDRNNTVKLRVTPPGADNAPADSGPRTFTLEPRWFIPRPTIPAEAGLEKMEPMSWPAIQKYLDHDLYVAFASSPEPFMHVVTLNPGEHKQVGPYDIFYLEGEARPMEYFGAHLYIKTEDGKVIQAQPGQMFLKDDHGRMMRSDEGMPGLYNVDETVPELKDEDGRPGGIILEQMIAGSRQVKLAVSLPGLSTTWHVPLSITYKPWVNLVWIGVLIAVMGTLLAMVRRMIDSRRDLRGNLPGFGDDLPDPDAD
jgi:cytochrome c-type biogenesis protein CcmF